MLAGPYDNNFPYMRTMGLDLHNNKGMWTRFWSEFLKAVAHFNKLCTEAGDLYMAGHTDLHQGSGPVWWLSNLTKWCFNEAGSKGHRCCSHSRSLLKKRTPGTEYMNAITTCYSLLTEKNHCIISVLHLHHILNATLNWIIRYNDGNTGLVSFKTENIFEIKYWCYDIQNYAMKTSSYHLLQCDL